MTHQEAAKECAALYLAFSNQATILHKAPSQIDWAICSPNTQPTVERLILGHRYKIQGDPSEFIWAIRSQSTPDKLWMTDDPLAAKGWMDDGLEVRIYHFCGWSFEAQAKEPAPQP